MERGKEKRKGNCFAVILFWARSSYIYLASLASHPCTFGNSIEHCAIFTTGCLQLHLCTLIFQYLELLLFTVWQRRLSIIKSHCKMRLLPWKSSFLCPKRKLLCAQLSLLFTKTC